MPHGAARSRTALLGLALALMVSATGASVEAALARPVASVAQNGPEAAEIRRILATIRMPPGFHIGLFALVPGARALAVGPNGTVFVGTTQSKIYSLTGGPADRAASVQDFAPDVAFRIPNGVCFAPDGTLYVAEQNRILAFPHAEAAVAVEAPSRTTIVAQGELIPKAEESSNHSARICRIGPDNLLYVALGQPSNVPPPEKLALYDRVGMGGIIRMARDGTGREVFARGIRNSVGMDFNPADKTLWFTDNQVDGMGDDIPPGEIDRVTRPGENFGFPWYGGGHTRTDRYRNTRPPAGLTFPVVEEVAHAADLGMMFYTGTTFPAEDRGAIFSAQHGSWNRTEPIGARVMITPVRPDGSAGPSRPFAEGWRQPDGSYAGRPVDVAEMKDGSLLVSDDDAGAVYRITYEGH